MLFPRLLALDLREALDEARDALEALDARDALDVRDAADLTDSLSESGLAAAGLPPSSSLSVGAGGAVALLAHFLNQLLFLSLHTQKNVVAKLR